MPAPPPVFPLPFLPPPPLLAPASVLEAANNPFGGSLPTRFGGGMTGLTLLDLSGCSLSGALSGVLQGLPSLAVLRLSRNRINGSFPSSWVGAPNLTYLDLSSNALSGPPPVRIAGVGLRFLDLSLNVLAGVFPSAFGPGLEALEELRMAGNVGITGVLPASVTGLPSLRHLNLRSCGLVGFLGGVLSGLPRLAHLDLSLNSLNGGFASAWGMETLESLSLDGNPLGGTIPSAFVGIPRLTSLSARACSLAGGLPTRIVGLPQLLYVGRSLFLLPVGPTYLAPRHRPAAGAQPAVVCSGPACCVCVAVAVVFTVARASAVGN
jgi:hypothetical protein